ncbi:MAG: [Fe-Fe] hydrogenase large subunit C-terminal domain-containing protein [Oscillospiraceae bacterium]
MKHSVVLDYKRCRGCTTCIKSCPTEAIRVRSGKAAILNARCIDCGRCIQVCPHKAIHSLSDPMEVLTRYRYNVALPDPALYGQFQNLEDVDLVLNGLLKIGFHAVYEIAKADELLSDYARQCISAGETAPKPQITSACPAVTRLICMRFPKLIDHIAPVATPLELAGILARREAIERTGFASEEIGVFVISPCSAQVTAAHSPENEAVNGAISVRDIYLALLGPMKELEEPEPMASAGIMGVGRACTGGESSARLREKYIAVGGIENVIRVLEELEDGRLSDADFVELAACDEGCVGGCLNVENPFGAQMHLKKLMRGLPVSKNRFTFQGDDRKIAEQTVPLNYSPVFALDANLETAMEKMSRIEALAQSLPGLHCGSCGAPSCHAFAEDVVLGRADPEDCIFKMRARMQNMTGDEGVDSYLPAPFRKWKAPKDPPQGASER